MGKQTGKKKKRAGGLSGDGNANQSKVVDNSPRANDNDTAVFISMSHELKEEGNKLFQRRDHEGAMIKFEKAIKLLPGNHIDVSHLRSNIAACYMQMGLSEYPRAIHECNLALEVTPKYSKALLKRARCYEALNKLNLALRDVSTVLDIEPKNLMALEILERVEMMLEKEGLTVSDTVIELPPEYVESPITSVSDTVIELPPEYVEPPITLPVPKLKEKKRKKKNNKVDDNKVEAKIEEKKFDDKMVEEKKAEDKVVVEEQISTRKEEEPAKTVKLVFGEDIRCAKLPLNCSLLQLREVIRDRFPSSRAVLIKYRDHEGDLITITTDEELRLSETSTESQVSFRLHIVEVNPEHDPLFERLYGKEELHGLNIKQNNSADNGNVRKGKAKENGSCYIDDWIVEFAQLFKNYVGFDSDSYLNLHQLSMKVYSEAMEETVTSEEAQDLFKEAAEKFQEMAALALFNCGNVHMSRARKRVYLSEDASKEPVVEQIKNAYDWAQQEFTKARERYEEALRIKPDFYEAILALGQQQFEQAKLSWYYVIGSNTNLETWPSTEVLQLYNHAEENMDRGMQMWEEMEEQQLSEFSKPKKVLKETILNGLFIDITADEAAEQATNTRSQINLLWGTILYERSLMEFKLGLPLWHECLEVAVEKFELAGASPTDMAVMIKNHSSNNNALEGLGFSIDEIIQARNEMYEAIKWQKGVHSFRLEPLLRRRVSKLCHALSMKELYAVEGI